MLARFQAGPNRGRSELVKVHNRHALLKLVFNFALLAAAVLDGWPERTAAQQRNPADTEAALRTARQMAAELTDKLRGLLVKELETGGSEGAVQVCAKTAQAVTQEFSQSSGHAVRRVSLGYRNPQGQPDRYERRVLAQFDQQARAKQLVSEQYEVVTEKGQPYLRYLKPIVTGKLCLNCHGQPEQIAPPVRAVLQKQYPADKATGYHEDDVRGAISVKIALAAKAGK